MSLSRPVVPPLTSADYANARKRGGGPASASGESEAKRARRQLDANDPADHHAEIQIALKDWQADMLDRKPASGRFSDSMVDDDDRACVLQPLPTGTKRKRLMAQWNAHRLEAAKHHRANPNADHQDDDVAMLDADAAEAQKALDPDAEMVVDENATVESMLAGMMARAQAEHDAEMARFEIRMRVDLSMDPLRDHKRCEGDIKLQKLYQCLNNLGYTRSEFQELFHEKFIQACLPIIFGDMWSMVCERIFEEFGIDRIRPEVLVQTPRRFGKR